MQSVNVQRVINMTDEEAYANALSDPDAQPLSDEALSQAVRLSDFAGKTIFERLRNLKKCSSECEH